MDNQFYNLKVTDNDLWGLYCALHDFKTDNPLNQKWIDSMKERIDSLRDIIHANDENEEDTASSKK